MTVKWDWERFEFPSPDEPCLHSRLPEDVNPLAFLNPAVSEVEFLKGLVAERKQQMKRHVDGERKKSVDVDDELKKFDGTANPDEHFSLREMELI